MDGGSSCVCKQQLLSPTAPGNLLIHTNLIIYDLRRLAVILVLLLLTQAAVAMQ